MIHINKSTAYIVQVAAFLQMETYIVMFDMVFIIHMGFIYPKSTKSPVINCMVHSFAISPLITTFILVSAFYISFIFASCVIRYTKTSTNNGWMQLIKLMFACTIWQITKCPGNTWWCKNLWIQDVCWTFEIFIDFIQSI